MPTARELLEQADALMRRRHEPAVPVEPAAGPATDVPSAPAPAASFDEPDDAHEASGPAREEARPAPSAAATLAGIGWSAPAPPPPTATSSPVFAPPPATSPRTIQREPIAPSVARTSLAVDPTESPLFPPADEGVAAHAPEPDFPVLTDAVPAEALPDDEVPLLTDAVAAQAEAEEPILEDDFAEPSVWTPTLGGATTIVHDKPPVVAAPEGARDPLGLDRPAPGFEPPSSVQWRAADDADRDPDAQGAAPPEVVDGAPVAAEPEAAEPRVETTFVEAPADVEAGAAEVQAPAVASAAEAVAAEAEAGAEMEADAEPVAVPAPFAAPAEGSLEAVPEAPLAAWVATPAAAPVAALAAAAGAGPDDAQVRAIAEEIGMQVLQRIDIFTDTELRARLAERLQPVLDRVSADLVAEINRHVGELLRGYVAAAIEGEIERWRDRQP